MTFSTWVRCVVLTSVCTLSRAAAAAEPTPNASPGGTPPSPTAAPSHEAELDLLTFYKDNYFITGFTMQTEAKFQFSAKFDLWPNRGQHAVYFAFTQKSLWDIYRTSLPFVENNYAPELFYSYFHVPGRYEPQPGCGFFFERVGIVHESTGEQARTHGVGTASTVSRASLAMTLRIATPRSPCSSGRRPWASRTTGISAATRVTASCHSASVATAVAAGSAIGS